METWKNIKNNSNKNNSNKQNPTTHEQFLKQALRMKTSVYQGTKKTTFNWIHRSKANEIFNIVEI